MKTLEHISIDVTNLCSKKCHFCYNESRPGGKISWEVAELLSFIKNCALHGIKAVSFGGGEPLQYEGIFDILESLRGGLFRTIITNGLFLYDKILKKLLKASPDAVQISIHFPECKEEVKRVIRQVKDLENYGIKSGINLLISHSKLPFAISTADKIRTAGINNERIVYIPMRFSDTPSPEELALAAGKEPFQSSRCLIKCNYSHTFCSIGWDKSVAPCSYTKNRRIIQDLTYEGLIRILSFFPQETPLNTVNSTYPVAHSTDAIWFALDADGHVGCFETGKYGYIPPQAHLIDYEKASSYPLKCPSMPMKKQTKALIDLEGLTEPGFEGTKHLVKAGKGYNLFFLLSRECLAKDLLKGYTITEFPSTKGIAIAIKEPITEELRNILHKEELCTGCFADCPKNESLQHSKNGMFTYYDLMYDGYKDPFIYTYSDDDNLENRIYGLYSRVTIPEVPATVEELSPSAPYLSETFRFSWLRFSERPHIHPPMEFLRYNKEEFYPFFKHETRSEIERRRRILFGWYMEDALRDAEKAEETGHMEKADYYLKKAIEFENMLKEKF